MSAMFAAVWGEGKLASSLASRFRAAGWSIVDDESPLDAVVIVLGPAGLTFASRLAVALERPYRLLARAHARLRAPGSVIFVSETDVLDFGQLARVAAIELAPDHRANALLVAPGAEASHVASAALFLAGDDASYVTGVLLPVS